MTPVRRPEPLRFGIRELDQLAPVGLALGAGDHLAVVEHDDPVGDVQAHPAKLS